MAQYTGFLMNWCAVRLRSAFSERVADSGLRPPQFAILTLVSDRPGITQQQLVDGTGVDPSTMVQLLDELEDAGLAERRTHPTDRRKRVVHLTAKGERRLAKAQRDTEPVIESTLDPLTESERAELLRLLRKLSGLD